MIERGALDAVLQELAKDADHASGFDAVNSVLTANGMTPLHTAVHAKQPEMVVALLDWGADPFAWPIPGLSNSTECALFTAVRLHHDAGTGDSDTANTLAALVKHSTVKPWLQQLLSENSDIATGSDSGAIFRVMHVEPEAYSDGSDALLELNAFLDRLL
jgi:hypothetical protein